VLAADCVPVGLIGPGAVAAAHAGWRGLAAGVIERSLVALHRLGGRQVAAWLGPCIRSCCYEFGAEDLAAWRARLGGTVVGRTAWGSDALDVPAAVAEVLRIAGVTRLTDAAPCTGCDPDYWSHRRRAEPERQGLVAWRRAS